MSISINHELTKIYFYTGDDFSQTDYDVRFEAGQLKGNLSIDIINDDELELTEEIDLLLFPGIGYGGGLQILQEQSIGRILNDDSVYSNACIHCNFYMLSRGLCWVVSYNGCSKGRRPVYDKSGIGQKAWHKFYCINHCF